MKQNKKNETRDLELEKRLERVDRWIREGKIPFSSKVVPIYESLSTQQWVLPTEQVIGILRNARSFALTKCECRERYQRCGNPLEVCFLINDEADKNVAEGKAHHIQIGKAVEVLRQANEKGLVHLTIYNPEQHVFAVCSCCACCCHDLQFLRKYGRADLIAHSDYIVHTDRDACVHCGDCVERCVFGARVWDDEQMNYNADDCYGCGLCVTVCSAKAAVLHRRKKT
ncbi:MAG: 4Fe-4S dicluster domain-containing protein [Candidatus Aminicenantes bacterium]|nr:MAG: 4Fe-4S dicluster domain-containing protein [Candidatus Aminicenantes bacterium]